MVIHQFNRLIRNKWIWGVFAVAISVFFAFDFLFVGGDDERSSAGSAGKLAGKDVTAKRFTTLADDIRGFGRNRDSSTPAAEVNLKAWRNAAALAVAEAAHITASDDEVRAAIRRDPSFQAGGGSFNYRAYEYLLRENGFTPEMFEAFLKRRITLGKLSQVVLGSAAWVSPAELEGAINDVTDKFTVRVAAFTDKDAGKVTVDDKALEAYYKDNTNSIALPDCVAVKYLKFKADAPERLKSFSIPADEVSNHWDVVQGEPRFQVKKGEGTNTVTETMSLDKAYPIVERELQLIASLEAYRTNLLFRVYPQDAKESAATDRFEKIAAEEKVTPVTTRRFSLEGRWVKGFMVRSSSIAPDCSGFSATVAELDPESEDLRYGVVAGTNAVYLVERAKIGTNWVEKAHVPAFAEAKEIIRGDALKDAQDKAFKAAVDKARALAAAEVAAGKPFDAKMFAGANVSTSITFAVSALQHNSFADSMYVGRATMKLDKGQFSDFIPTHNPRRGLVVYVEKRENGDAAQAQIVRAQLRDELARGAAGDAEDWSRWNLERLGFEANSMSSVVPVDESEVPED